MGNLLVMSLLVKYIFTGLKNVCEVNSILKMIQHLFDSYHNGVLAYLLLHTTLFPVGVFLMEPHFKSHLPLQVTQKKTVCG